MSFAHIIWFCFHHVKTITSLISVIDHNKKVTKSVNFGECLCEIKIIADGHRNVSGSKERIEKMKPGEGEKGKPSRRFTEGG